MRKKRSLGCAFCGGQRLHRLAVLDLSCSGLPCRHLLHHIQQTIGQGAMAAPDNQRRTLAESS